jgi:hypothetical protein
MVFKRRDPGFSEYWSSSLEKLYELDFVSFWLGGI